MRTGLSRLFKNSHRQGLAAVVFMPRGKPDRGGHPSGTATDNQDIDIQSFTLQNRLPPGLRVGLKCGDQRWHHLKQISNDTEISDLEDGCICIFVHRHDRPRTFHSYEMLNRA